MPPLRPEQPRTQPVFVFWRESPTRSDGEVRGEFWDVGRLRDDDSRFSELRFPADARGGERRPLARATRCSCCSAPAWSRRPLPSAPNLRGARAVAGPLSDRGVTVTGRFRGRNLFGDLPSALPVASWDFVLQSADAAIWVSSLRPRGSGFELDPGAKVDTGTLARSVAAPCTPTAARSWIDGESLRLAEPPTESDVEPPPGR